VPRRRTNIAPAGIGRDQQRGALRIAGIADGLKPGELLDVTAKQDIGKVINFQVKCRLDSVIEIEYYRNGGILQYVLRGLAGTN